MQVVLKKPRDPFALDQAIRLLDRKLTKDGILVELRERRLGVTASGRRKVKARRSERRRAKHLSKKGG
jgi:ribosomal protein S21